MKRSLKMISLLLVALLLITGCGKVPKLKNGEDAVVSLKDDKLISIDELYKELKDKYALEALVSLIDLHIFETEFADYSKTAKEKANEYVNQMIEAYGSEAEFVSAIQQNTNFSTLEGYIHYIYISDLQSHAAYEFTKTIVTDKQIKTYYKDNIKEDIELSHILITPDVSSEAEESEIKKAEEKAKKTITDIIKSLDKVKSSKDIKKKFEELALKHSEDDSTKENGGSLGRINNYNSLSEDYDELLKTAYKLKDGKYSTSVITTELGYHVILKTKTYEKTPVKELNDTIRDILAEDFLLADPSLALKSLKHYRKEYKMDIVDSELKKQYDKYLKSHEDYLKKLQEQQSQWKKASAMLFLLSIS